MTRQEMPIDHHTFKATSCTNRIKHCWTKINCIAETAKSATKINSRRW